MDNSTGQVGERYAAKQLKKMGYKILYKNYHSRFGEIDIVAANSQYIVFVEVKTRMEKGSLIHPFEAITPQKRAKILATARAYLMVHTETRQPRFDVAAVFTENGKVTDFQYLENAF